MAIYRKARIILVSLMLVLSACTNFGGPQIGNAITLCCPGSYASYSSFGVENTNLPVFLRGYVTDEFDQAFQELGMTRDDGNGDLVVNLAYRHVSLDSEQEDIDPFTRVESMNVELRYVANIDITMRERQTGSIVWAGNISRIHSVQPGEYMHQESARPAFLDTFRDLLQGYPTERSD